MPKQCGGCQASNLASQLPVAVHVAAVEKIRLGLLQQRSGYVRVERAEGGNDVQAQLRGENEPSPGLDAHLLELELATRGKDVSAVVRRLSELVPTFRPAAAPTPAPRAAS